MGAARFSPTGTNRRRIRVGAASTPGATRADALAMAFRAGRPYRFGMPRGRPREFDRQQALQRAMELFRNLGYEAASLSELVRVMGISRQSLYDTFGSKRELYVSAIEHYRETQLARALALLERDRSPLENVRSVVRFFEELASDARCRGCFVANALVEMGPRDAEIAGFLRETLELLRRGIERALQQARARGELPRAKSPRRLSWALTNAMIGLAVTGKLEIGDSDLRAIQAGTLSMLA